MTTNKELADCQPLGKKEETEMMTQAKLNYRMMLEQLTETYDIRLEKIAIDLSMGISTLYRIKRGQEPRTLAAQKGIERYYRRVINRNEEREKP